LLEQGQMRRYDIAPGREMPPPKIVKESEGTLVQFQCQDERRFAVDADRPY